MTAPARAGPPHVHTGIVPDGTFHVVGRGEWRCDECGVEVPMRTNCPECDADLEYAPRGSGPRRVLWACTGCDVALNQWDEIIRRRAPRAREPSAAMDPALVETFDTIDRYRATHPHDEVRYSVRWRWSRSGWEERLYRKRGSAERQVEKLSPMRTDYTPHWNPVMRRVEQQRVDAIQVAPSVVPMAFRAGADWMRDRLRACQCGCGETFLPRRSDQRFLNATHRRRVFDRKRRIVDA